MGKAEHEVLEAAWIYCVTQQSMRDWGTVENLIDALYESLPKGIRVQELDTKAGYKSLVKKKFDDPSKWAYGVAMQLLIRPPDWVLKLKIDEADQFADTPRVNFDPTKKTIRIGNIQSMFDINDQMHVSRLLSAVKRAISVLSPVYAWGGHQRKEIFNFAGRDPRRQIWGYNFFGKELVSVLGEGRLRNLEGPDWRVEPAENSGIILYNLPNPFLSSRGSRTEAAKYLELDAKLADKFVADWPLGRSGTIRKARN
jgi:hypothetical protein